jgi:dihydroxyacetone kinase phosphotransfer subunit
MSENVGIVIVSHSADVARGTALMVEQMVGREVPLGWCGGDPGGGLGTSVEAIMKAIEQAWSERGVAILVDLGGAETNSEMAIEMLPEERRDRVVVCNAPVVEGAVMAATEASTMNKHRASVLMRHEVGLHARPSVKLTKLAKAFESRIDLGLSPDGPWVDAKSIVKVMATKAPKDTTIYFRAEGVDAKAALEALVTLVDGDFQDGR